VIHHWRTELSKKTEEWLGIRDIYLHWFSAQWTRALTLST